MDKSTANALDYLRCKIRALSREVCDLQSGEITVETDPIFSASPAFDITSPEITNWNESASLMHEHSNMATLQLITTGKPAQWDSAYSALGTQVLLTGDQTIEGIKTFTFTPVFAANITPDASNTRDNGSATLKWANVYSTSFLNPTSTAAFGVTAVGNGITFRQGSSTQIVGGFHVTTGNFYLQAAGVIPTDSTYRLTVGGTTLLNGSVSVNGNITPDGDGTRALGGPSFRFIMYSSTIAKGSNTAGLNFTAATASDVYARVQGTTHNWIFQQSGAAGAETNYRVAIDGTGATTGALLVNNGAVTINSNTTISGQLTTNIVLGTGATVWGTSVTNQVMAIRQGNGSQFVSGWHLTTGNYFIQAAGAIPTDTGERLQVVGTTLLNGAITFGGSMTPNANGTLSIGATGARLAAVWSDAFISSSSPYFGTTSQASNILFRFGTTSQLIAGFHATTGNHFIQAFGTLPADTGQKLQVIGTTLLNGVVTLGGNLLPSADGTLNIGSAALRMTLFTTGVHKGSAGVNMNFGVTGSSDIFARFHLTTHNFMLQAAGAAGTDDTISRLQVIGKIRVTDVPTYADNAAALAGGLIVGNHYKLADGHLMIVV